MAKFSDKLAKLRKENNLSQEQLADKLNMSRQSISKWELGLSYPDMEKIIEICGVLNCTLDNLLDDGVIKNQKQQGMKFNDLIQELLKFITNSYNMFWSMKFKEKIFFLFESAFIIFTIIIAFVTLDSLLSSLFYPITNGMHNLFGSVISYIFSTIYKIIKIVLGFIIFIHLFRIRYLDYYITVEDDTVKKKKIEEPIDEIKNIREDKKGNMVYERRKEKVIIRDPKHSGYNLINWMTNIFILFWKLFVALAAIPLIISFVTLISFAMYIIMLSSNGVIFITIALAIFGSIIINYIILEVSYYLVVNKSLNFRRIFIIFIIGLLAIGIGIGSTSAILGTFDRTKNYDTINKIVETKTIEYNENTIIDFINKAKIVYTNNNEIKIELTCLEFNYCNIYESNDNNQETYYYSKQINTDKLLEIYKQFIKEIKKKKIFNLHFYEENITIYISELNYQKLINK